MPADILKVEVTGISHSVEFDTLSSNGITNAFVFLIRLETFGNISRPLVDNWSSADDKVIRDIWSDTVENEIAIFGLTMGLNVGSLSGN